MMLKLITLLLLICVALAAKQDGLQQVFVDQIAPDQSMNVHVQKHSQEPTMQDSVGVLFRTSKNGFVHMWLPLGQRLYSGR